MSVLAKFWPAQAEPSTIAVITGTVVATALFSLTMNKLFSKSKVIDNPLKTYIHKLPSSEIANLDYKPDEFPGARDVATPYGSIRVYEWGPEDGPKVLMIHGITTSCHTLTKIANALVGKGCRVMLYDLFGRGFSDGVGDVPHDARLYVAQALLAMASSPLSWTGTDAVRVIGYSMGGGIAVHLAGAFPHMVSSLVLLAPAGLIRPENFGIVQRVLFTSRVVPDFALAALSKWRLQKPIAPDAKLDKRAKGSTAKAPPAEAGPTQDENATITAVARTLTGGALSADPISSALTEAVDPIDVPTPLAQRVLRYVQWMVQHHEGFVSAFIGSLSDAPLTGQQDAYKLLAARAPGTTAMILGADDRVVSPDNYKVDALPLVGGTAKCSFAVVPGGHDFPMTHPTQTLAEIYKVWEM